MEAEVKEVAVNRADDVSFPMPRKANDVIAEALAQGPQPALFDGFWRKGELALMFGAAGVGKSLLAVQIADALARGRPIDGFDMPRRRHKVLYVDLTLSDMQFQRRYTAAGADGSELRPYKFAERFYHGRPSNNGDLCSWVSSAVRTGGFEVVVIDDLSAVMRTDDGTFDSLRIMRAMKRLSHETGVSVLVLADSFESPRHDISEADLRRSRVLCGVADSVFAIGRWGRGNLKLVQFRSQGAEVVWGTLNPVGCMIRRRENGLLGFGFDERFQPRLDPERCRLICTVNEMWGQGMGFRDIAEHLGISKSRASRLFHAWTPAAYALVHGEKPALDSARYGWSPEDFADVDDDYEDDEYSEDEDPDDYRSAAPDETAAAVPSPRPPRYDLIPFAAGLRRRSIYDLEFSYDNNGREIWVESREEHSGKPKVWYWLDSQRIVIHATRSNFCVIHKPIGKSGWI